LAFSGNRFHLPRRLLNQLRLLRAPILISAMLALFCGQSSAKGVYVRFLANPAEDSIVRYIVYRSTVSGDSGEAVGELAAVAGRDTLSFPDSNVDRGKPYFYTITARNAGGLESDRSTETEEAFPLLSLPDTLRPDAVSRLTRVSLSSGADPMNGAAPLSVSLADSARFFVTYDAGTHRATFRSRSGLADTARLIVRAGYFGKFEDRDTALVIVSASSSVSISAPAISASTPSLARMRLPAGFSIASQGGMILRDLPGPGDLQILSLSGAEVYAHRLAAAKEDLLWDGRDPSGRTLKPARYLAVVRDCRGRLLDSGVFSLAP
jgi:hypothetical protein